MEGKIAELADMSDEEKEGLKIRDNIRNRKKLNQKKKQSNGAIRYANKDGGKQKFKEGSKPDFLDLDKGGNKTEPMKQAAKQKVTAKGGVRTAIAKIKKAKDGSRTGVRGTGAAKKGFRKARMS